MAATVSSSSVSCRHTLKGEIVAAIDFSRSTLGEAYWLVMSLPLNNTFSISALQHHQTEAWSGMVWHSCACLYVLVSCQTQTLLNPRQALCQIGIENCRIVLICLCRGSTNPVPPYNKNMHDQHRQLLLSLLTGHTFICDTPSGGGVMSGLVGE